MRNIVFCVFLLDCLKPGSAFSVRWQFPFNSLILCFFFIHMNYSVLLIWAIDLSHIKADHYSVTQKRDPNSSLHGNTCFIFSVFVLYNVVHSCYVSSNSGKIQKDGRKESCKPILKVEYKTSRSRCVLFNWILKRHEFIMCTGGTKL